MLKEYDTFSLHYQLGGGSRWRQVPVVSIHAGIDHINLAVAYHSTPMLLSDVLSVACICVSVWDVNLLQILHTCVH